MKNNSPQIEKALGRDEYNYCVTKNKKRYSQERDRNERRASSLLALNTAANKSEILSKTNKLCQGFSKLQIRYLLVKKKKIKR